MTETIAPTPERMATRYECVNLHNLAAGWHHTSGVGRPRRRRCAECGGELRVLTGWYGRFIHSSRSGRATYRRDEALSLWASEDDAMAAVADPSGECVRWIDAP